MGQIKKIGSLDREYAKIPNALFRQDISPLSMTVLAYMISLPDGYHTSAGRIADVLPMSRSTIHRCLRELKASSLIETSERIYDGHHRRISEYAIRLDRVRETQKCVTQTHSPNDCVRETQKCVRETQKCVRETQKCVTQDTDIKTKDYKTNNNTYIESFTDRELSPQSEITQTDRRDRAVDFFSTEIYPYWQPERQGTLDDGVDALVAAIDSGVDPDDLIRGISGYLSHRMDVFVQDPEQRKFTAKPRTVIERGLYREYMTQPTTDTDAGIAALLAMTPTHYIPPEGHR